MYYIFILRKLEGLVRQAMAATDMVVRTAEGSSTSQLAVLIKDMQDKNEQLVAVATNMTNAAADFKKKRVREIIYFLLDYFYYLLPISLL